MNTLIPELRKSGIGAFVAGAHANKIIRGKAGQNLGPH